MVRKYIKRDFTDHEFTTEYLSDDDEYIRLEIFSFDPVYTQTYTPEAGTLVGENTNKTNWRSWACFQSKDKINPMEFTLDYKVEDDGLYRIDFLYEKNSIMYGTDDSNSSYNTGKDLIGWQDVYLKGSKEEHIAAFTNKKKTKVVTPDKGDSKTKKLTKDILRDIAKLTPQQIKDNKYIDNLLLQVNDNILDSPDTSEKVLFEGENNVLKRKTLFKSLNSGDWKVEFAVPHNCYVFGAIIRKVMRFWGTNDDAPLTNLQFTNAKFTNSEMGKPIELEATIGYDDSFETDLSPTGLYMNYMDECNLYVKNNEGIIEQIFGGYVATPIPDSENKEITIHGTDRLRDGENKYILDQLLLQNGDGSESEYEANNTISFNKHTEVLSYLCKLYEITLNHNIDKDYNVEGEIFLDGFTVSYGKKKDIKDIPVTNGQVTINKNSVMVRNNSSGKKKQIWTLYDAKKHGKKPINITDYPNFHIKYGLGNPKSEYKRKETSNVDIANSTAGSQKFSKCGVSQDKKYVMAIGKVSAGKRGSFKPNQLYKSIFRNKCPHCGKATLRWDSARSDTKCIFTQHWNGSKRNWDGGIPETEITCNHCDSDFDAVTGWEKDGKYSSKLKKVGSTVKSTKSEQTKLHNGKLYALPKGNVTIDSSDIFKAIKQSVKGYTHQTGTGSTASYLEKHHKGDCWAWSEKISKELKRYKVNHKIVQYATNSSSRHRSVLYQNKDGKYVDFPYSEYNFPNGTHATSGSKHGKTIYKYTSGGRINQAVVSGSTNRMQTTETTITKGYDREKPFQCYIDICYSLENSFKSKKYHIYLDFTQKARSDYSQSGLVPVWVNNSSKEITLVNLISRIRDYQGEDAEIFLQSISFVAPKIKTTNTDESTDWYTEDNNINDNSSCKMLLYSMSFDNKTGVQPADLQACGKSVNDILKDILDVTGYVVDMTYAEHRCDDKINFRVNTSETPVFTATEGNNNNILEWGNINYDPANELFNMSMCVFKKNKTNKYYYVDSRYTDSILKYQEQCTLITENEPIGEKEAYWNARHNEKFNPEQTYSFTITVKGFPDVRLKELVEVIANAKKLNTLKECESIVLNYDISEKPVIQTELGLGELAPDLQVAKNIKLLRDNAKSKTTSFSSGATPITDESVYEWDN